MGDTFQFRDETLEVRLNGTLHDPEATAGDVLTVQSDGSVAAEPGGGSGVGGLAIYGDGSDGDVTLDSDTFNFPDPTAIPSWQANHTYAPGDRVTSTGNSGTPRIFACQIGGTSGGSDPFPATDPGQARRGDRWKDPHGGTTAGTSLWWEAETAINDGVLEGPLFCETFDDGGHALRVDGWIIFAHTAATITGAIAASGAAAVGPLGGQNLHNGLQTYLGQGCDGPDADGGFGAGVAGNSAYGSGPIIVWGGGIGGQGGAGDGGDGGDTQPSAGQDTGGFTLARRQLTTLFLAMLTGTYQIGSSGASGAGDGVAEKGGGGGAAGSAFAIFARALTFSGSIDCTGGVGGDGGATSNTGGGGGGSGGCCVLIYDSKTGAGTVAVSGGAAGAGQGTGGDGLPGSPGDAVEMANAT